MQLHAVNVRRQRPVFGLVAISVMMSVFQVSLRANESVTLAWLASDSTNVAGYKIHYGTACGCYTNAVTVGNTNQATIPGLVPGRQYYFAATTLDRAGDESGYSNEAGYVMPVTPPLLTAGARQAGQFGFTVTGDAGQQYVVQASTDLVTWSPIETNAAPFQFTDRSASGFSQRYYRVFYLPP